MMNWQDKAGKTPLHHAAEYGQSEMVSFLLAREISYDLESALGRNALHLAIMGSSLDAVKAILSDPKVEKEKILDRPDKQGRTPLHLASFKENEQLTKVLLDFGAKRDMCDVSGLQPVELAAKAGRRKSKELLEEGA